MASHKLRRVLFVPHTGNRYVVQHFHLVMLMGHQPVLAMFSSSGADKGKLRYSGEVPDLIIQMGLGTDEKRLLGLEHVQYLREQYPRVPILVMSGHDPLTSRKDVFKWGGSDFLQCTVSSQKEGLTNRQKKAFFKRVQRLLRAT